MPQPRLPEQLHITWLRRFWNLLSNAVKFTESGGRVQVTLTRDEDLARVAVTDTGIGISRGFLPYVFDRFRQADSSYSRSYGGLGLGLALARHLVELHGGTIEVSSEGEGRGSTFTARVPRRAADAAPESSAQEPIRTGS